MMVGNQLNDIVNFRDILFSDIEKIRKHRIAKSTSKWLENQSYITQDQQEEWFKSNQHKNHKIIIFNSNEVGIARLKIKNSQTIEVGIDLYEKYRGLKISEKCLRELLLQIDKKYKSIQLWAFEDNIPAIKIYKNIGFIEDNKEPVKYLKRNWDKSKLYAYKKFYLKVK